MINGTEKILVCCGTGCIANGALGVADAIQRELEAQLAAEQEAAELAAAEAEAVYVYAGTITSSPS